MKKSRLSKSDWITLGIEALRENGPDALIVEEMCIRAGKTRGSFYFHFTAIDDFLTSVTQSWFEQYTLAITTKSPSLSGRTDILNQLAARLDLDLETQIRRLAARYEDVQQIVQKADNDRIAWLASLYESIEIYASSQAKALAKIEYAAFSGFRLIDPNMKPNEARELYETFLELTNRARS